ncbi:uncharacterized protein CTHT_0039170 [Thermochaetoides thermophila DSM 1495]|uniref:Mitochondrial K+-H+ exchange-related-domain-containing protein n=1 Tax=Chaetomium thermophilum (strain DSM 1495 / CBS 144.50 / IMI 039719) TaxID=759272 RepID=G0S3X0_CHATD|nr:hypothetical protein CTHT_0039170 [Thermochaetoides thermophila DSM 1495]EGS22032.1 hypothetical protein CTHT_0039170 [Thermochaetoides thermophila DSM 1495]
MRLYLLPISTRRTLLYCQRLNTPAAAESQTTWADKIQAKAARTWSGWEKRDRGWQKAVVSYGNYLLRRIPYEEWGLKSVPPLSQRRREVELDGSEKVEVIYPQSLLSRERIPRIIGQLATEREALHKARLIWCLVGVPITIPIGLIPLVPNLPFFYLAYRAWSHWRALSGGKHLQFLVNNNLLHLSPSPVVDEVYANRPQESNPTPLASSPEPTTSSPSSMEPVIEPSSYEKGPQIGAREVGQAETMLLTQEKGKKMTQALDLPQLEVELERAIWQVETAIRKRSAEVAGAAAAAENVRRAEVLDEKKGE